MPSSLVSVTIGKTVDSEAMHSISKVLPSIGIAIPEMVVAKSMLDTPLEFPNVAAAILAGVHAIPMALPIGPFSGVHIPGVEPVYAVPVPKPLPVLAPVPASPGPGLDAIAVVLAVDPVPLVPATHVVVVDAAAGAAAAVELALVDIAVAVDLDEMAGGGGGGGGGGRGADGPEDGGSARAAEREGEGEREGEAREGEAEEEEERMVGGRNRKNTAGHKGVPIFSLWVPYSSHRSLRNPFCRFFS